MNSEFTRAAHRKSVFAQLQRIVQEKYVDGDAPAKERLVCEEAFYSDREITQEAFFDVIEALRDLEETEERRLRRFVLRERNEQATSTKVGKQKEDSGRRGKGRKPGKKQGRVSDANGDAGAEGT
jgi:hypothetical protein